MTQYEAHCYQDYHCQILYDLFIFLCKNMLGLYNLLMVFLSLVQFTVVVGLATYFTLGLFQGTSIDFFYAFPF